MRIRLETSTRSALAPCHHLPAYWSRACISWPSLTRVEPTAGSAAEMPSAGHGTVRAWTNPTNPTAPPPRSPPPRTVRTRSRACAGSSGVRPSRRRWANPLPGATARSSPTPTRSTGSVVAATREQAVLRRQPPAGRLRGGGRGRPWPALGACRSPTADGEVDASGRPQSVRSRWVLREQDHQRVEAGRPRGPRHRGSHAARRDGAALPLWRHLGPGGRQRPRASAAHRGRRWFPTVRSG